MNQYITRDILIYSPDDFHKLNIYCFIRNSPIIPASLILSDYDLLYSDFLPYDHFPLAYYKCYSNPYLYEGNLEGLLKPVAIHCQCKMIKYLLSFIGPNPYVYSDYDQDIGCFMATLTGAVEGGHPKLFEHLLMLLPAESLKSLKNDNLLDDPFQSAIKTENFAILNLFRKHDLIRNNINIKMADRVIHEKSNPDLLLFFNEYVDPAPDWQATLSFAIKHQNLPLYYRAMTETAYQNINPRNLFFLYGFTPFPASMYLTLKTPLDTLYKYTQDYPDYETSFKIFLPILRKIKNISNIGPSSAYYSRMYDYWQFAFRGACYSGNFNLIEKIYQERNQLHPVLDSEDSELSVSEDIIDYVDYFTYGIYFANILENTRRSDEQCWETLQSTIQLFIHDPITPINKEEAFSSCLSIAAACCRPLVIQKLLPPSPNSEELNKALTNLCAYYPFENKRHYQVQKTIRILQNHGATRCTKRHCFNKRFLPEIHYPSSK